MMKNQKNRKKYWNNEILLNLDYLKSKIGRLIDLIFILDVRISSENVYTKN